MNVSDKLVVTRPLKMKAKKHERKKPAPLMQRLPITIQLIRIGSTTFDGSINKPGVHTFTRELCEKFVTEFEARIKPLAIFSDDGLWPISPVLCCNRIYGTDYEGRP